MNHRILNQNPDMPVTIQIGGTKFSHCREQGLPFCVWDVWTIHNMPAGTHMTCYLAVVDDFGNLTEASDGALDASGLFGD